MKIGKSPLHRPWPVIVLVVSMWGLGLAGCTSTRPPAPVPAARKQALFIAESAAKLSQIENWPAAAREWQKAEAQFAALNDLPNEAVALHNQAQAQRELDQPELAHQLLSQAAELNAELGRTNEWWRNQIALVQIELQLAPAKTTEPDVRTNATLPVTTGSAGTRLDHLQSLFPQLKTPDLRGLFWNELGRWQHQQGKLTEALDSLRQAEIAFVAANLPKGLAAVKANRAELLLSQGDPEAARREWQQALSAYETLADLPGIALALDGQGRALLTAKQDLPEAEKGLRRAAQNYRTLNRPSRECDSLDELIQCLKQQNKPFQKEQLQLARAQEAAAARREASNHWEAAGRHWQAAADLWATLQQPARRDQALEGVRRCSPHQK